MRKKRICPLTAAFALSLILLLTACGGKSGTENPDLAENAELEENAENPDEIPQIEDIGETRDLSEVGESAAESESLCAAAYCGSRGGYADALAAFEHLRLSEKYPDLTDISVFDTGGNEFYVLVPASRFISARANRLYYYAMSVT